MVKSVEASINRGKHNPKPAMVMMATVDANKGRKHVSNKAAEAKARIVMTRARRFNTLSSTQSHERTSETFDTCRLSVLKRKILKKGII